MRTVRSWLRDVLVIPAKQNRVFVLLSVDPDYVDKFANLLLNINSVNSNNPVRIERIYNEEKIVATPKDIEVDF